VRILTFLFVFIGTVYSAPVSKLANTLLGETEYAQKIFNDDYYNKHLNSGYNKVLEIEMSSTGIIWYEPLIGCASQAITSICNYYKYPYISKLDSYDWDLVPLKLETTSSNFEEDEISKVMYDIADITKTVIWPTGSWATLNDVSDGLKALGYGNTIRLNRRDFNDNDWEEIIKYEIDSKKPVIYRAGDMVDSDKWLGNIHYFVIDGYTLTGYFWRKWGNTSTGDLFDINNMNNPYDEKNDHYMFINIYPTKSFDEIYKYTSAKVKNYKYKTLTYTRNKRHQSSEKNYFVHKRAEKEISVRNDNNPILVESDEKLYLEVDKTKKGKITLKDGFQVKRGGIFRASIHDRQFPIDNNSFIISSGFRNPIAYKESLTNVDGADFFILKITKESGNLVNNYTYVGNIIDKNTVLFDAGKLPHDHSYIYSLELYLFNKKGGYLYKKQIRTIATMGL